MAGIPPPRQSMPTLFNSSDAPSTAPDRPKLRNSCHACASSKLKCSQEKPTCARCQKRNLNCEYVVAKRGGRKPNRSNNNEVRGNGPSNIAVRTSQDVQSNGYPSQSPDLGTGTLRWPGDMRQPVGSASDSSQMLRDFFNPMDHMLPCASTSTETDIDDFFTSPMSFPSDLSDINIFQTIDFFPTGIDSSSSGSEGLPDAFPLFEDAVSELLALSVPGSSPDALASPSKEVHSYHEIRGAEQPCSCLIQALGFMRELLPSPSSACMTWTTQGLDQDPAAPVIQSVIARNEATIEAMGNMLQCSCSHDGYLLTIMSLIIFKVLGWYAAVARKMPSLQGAHGISSSHPSPSEQLLRQNTTVGSYCIDGENSARMIAQLVLNELHKVRRLVGQLSSKLRLQAAQNGEGDPGTPESFHADNEMNLSLSSMMYSQLDADLKKRLRTLSLEMIDRLRRL